MTSWHLDRHDVRNYEMVNAFIRLMGVKAFGGVGGFLTMTLLMAEINLMFTN